MKKSIVRSAITDENGDVDVGYLSLMWGLVGWTVSTATILGIGVFSVWKSPAVPVTDIIKSIGDASIGISAGFASMLGAVGLFRMGDKPRAPTTGSAP